MKVFQHCSNWGCCSGLLPAQLCPMYSLAGRGRGSCDSWPYLFPRRYGGRRSVGHRAEGGAWPRPRGALRVPISSHIVDLSSKDGHVLYQGLAEPKAQATKQNH